MINFIKDFERFIQYGRSCIYIFTEREFYSFWYIFGKGQIDIVHFRNNFEKGLLIAIIINPEMLRYIFVNGIFFVVFFTKGQFTLVTFKVFF